MVVKVLVVLQAILYWLKNTAADGHIIYDNKLNDKVTLGTDPTKAVTVDGTTGTIKAGKDGNAVAINGTDGTIKAGDGTNAVASMAKMAL